MRYFVRRRRFRVSDIRFFTEDRRLAYRAREPFFGFTQELKNAAGETVLGVCKVPLSRTADFEVLRGDNVIATVAAEDDEPDRWYRVRMDGQTAISIRPNSSTLDFNTPDGRIAALHSPWMPFKPMELTIFDERRAEIAIAVTVAILHTPPRNDDNQL